jgi:hypothetical protein
LYFQNEFIYKTSDFTWNKTIQNDYVANSISTYKEPSLNYTQRFYQYNIGLYYSDKIFQNINFTIHPYFIFTNIKAKDSHLLRNFYTMQYSNAYGYGLKGKIDYSLNVISTFSFYYNYETFKENKTDMRYYNLINENYLTLPSSYKSRNTIIGFSYKYKF